MRAFNQEHLYFFKKIIYYTSSARSSNGRTAVSGTAYLGSNPSRAACKNTLFFNVFLLLHSFNLKFFSSIPFNKEYFFFGRFPEVT